jgi:hypothetical protein
MTFARTGSPRARATAAAVVLALAVALTGCSQDLKAGQTRQTSAPISTSVGSGDLAASAPIVRTPKNATIPSFSGTWAGAFESAYRAATSDLQRSILSDGTISDKELSELGDRFSACLSASGYTKIHVFPGDAGFSLDAPKGVTTAQQNTRVSQCENSAYGQADILYGEVNRNPSNQNEFTIMAACLVRQKLVPPTFTAADYGRDANNNSFPFDVAKNDAKFSACVSDPLDAGK